MKNIEIRNQTENTVDIYVLGVIGETFSASEFIYQMNYFKDYSINIHIFSPGGLAFEALAVYDFVKGQGIKGTVYIYGLAGSAATIISSAFDKVLIGENSKFFIHHAYGGSDKGLADVNETIVNIYKNKTGLRKDTIIKLMKAGDDGDFMNAAKAKELGFVNGIFKEDSINNEFEDAYKIAANFDINNYKNKYMENNTFLDKVLARINEGFVTKSAYEELSNEFNALKEEQKKFDDEKKDFENTIVNLTETIATKEKEAQEIQNNLTTANATIEAMKEEKQVLTDIVKEKEIEIENLKAEIEELKKEPVSTTVIATATNSNATATPVFSSAREQKRKFLLGNK
jgi:ATP-dependent protease ClpP protease subunit